MTQIDQTTITEAVIKRLENTPDERLRVVLGALVRHLHDFAREVSLTDQEWACAVEFLTKVGQRCDEDRQEFILLSDVLGLSSLVDMLNHQMPAGCTPSTPIGPFHVQGAPEVPMGGDVAQGAPGKRCQVSGVVRDLDGKPVAGAHIDVWQADANGLYDVQYEDLGHAQARARLTTDENGRYAFESVLAEPYQVPTDGPVGALLAATARRAWRPAHLHFIVCAPGFKKLVTHVFRDDDPYVNDDAVFAVRPGLIAPWRAMPDGSYRLEFDFVLERGAQ